MKRYPIATKEFTLKSYNPRWKPSATSTIKTVCMHTALVDPWALLIVVRE